MAFGREKKSQLAQTCESKTSRRSSSSTGNGAGRCRGCHGFCDKPSPPQKQRSKFSWTCPVASSCCASPARAMLTRLADCPQRIFLPGSAGKGCYYLNLSIIALAGVELRWVEFLRIESAL
eukprot:2493748-Rhodomonas_salina.4